jgi:hypothetical protein
MQSLRRKLKGDARGLSNALPPSRSASRVGCSIEPEKRRFRGGTPDTAGSQKLGPFRRGAYRGLGDPVAYGKGMPVFFFSASKGKEPPGLSRMGFFGSGVIFNRSDETEKVKCHEAANVQVLGGRKDRRTSSVSNHQSNAGTMRMFSRRWTIYSRPCAIPPLAGRGAIGQLAPPRRIVIASRPPRRR